MSPLFQIPGFFQDAYTPSQPKNCCCGPSSGVNVNINTEPPTVGPIVDSMGGVVRRTDEAGRLIAEANREGYWLFQGV
jgi:hypothetical protein